MNYFFEIIGFAIMLLIYIDILTVDYDKPIKWPVRLTHRFWPQVIWQVICFAAAAWLILQNLYPSVCTAFGLGMTAIAGTIVQLLIFLTAVLIFAILIMIEINPAGFIHMLRGKNDKTAIVTEAPVSKTVVWEEKYFYTNDIKFESRYPNNFFDIYSTDRDFTKKKPVFLYAHGGGYIWGDKTNGDPNALGIAGVIRMIEQMADAGFLVVSANYVLAPEYAYPAPVVQMSELLEFLKENADSYGMDMNRVVIGGGSAGGQIAAQLANLQTNRSYAQEMGIAPILKNHEIKAVYHGCALLDNERFGATSSFLTNFIFYQMGRVYFKTDLLKGNSSVIQSNVIRSVTPDYPPSFICDGNAGTFNEQAHDLAYKLTSLGVRNKTMIFDRTADKKIPHGFDTLEYEEGYRSMKAMVAFVSQEVM